MTGQRLLLVSPGFHGYWRSIADAFSRRGYAVQTHVYDAESAWGRVRHKATVELPARVGATPRPHHEVTDRALTALREARPDVVLVIKGDVLGEPFWTQAQRVARRALWLYDELRRTTHTPASLAAASAIASYSRLDVAALRADGHQALHVPLAHDPHVPVSPRTSGEVTFVGARYASREAVLVRLQELGVPVRAYGRDWSSHALDRLRTWRLGTSGVPGGRDLTRPDAYAVLAGSLATMNLHGDQDGFTMRTFEAAGVGALQLIDRHDVSEVYEPGREVAVFADAEEAADLARRAQADAPWAWRLREAARARTLAEHTFDHRAAQLESLWA